MKSFKQYIIAEGKGHDAVMQFASIQHDNWRNSFDPGNTGKERVKKNSDGTEGNINVPFNKLHPDWQRENVAAGKAALMAIRKHKGNIEAAAEHVHNEWMKRNPKADYNAAQHVPYHELPEDEKEKDRQHVRTMSNILGGGK
jgi:DNA gyrase inhibitor GyrI